MHCSKPVFVVLVTVLVGLSSAFQCNEVETTEAENAFKNCVESAQAGIVTKASEQKDQQQLCDALENMLSGCQKQKELLAECKGVSHAEKIKQLHLSVTADIISALNRRVNVERCSVFTRKTATPAVHHTSHSGHKKHHNKRRQHSGHHERSTDSSHGLRAEANVAAAAAEGDASGAHRSMSAAAVVVMVALAAQWVV